jgi:FtsZ-interacting cell division protein ZipA
LRTAAPQRIELPPLEPEIAFEPTGAAGLAPELISEIDACFAPDPATGSAGALPAGQDVPPSADPPLLVQWPPDGRRVVLALRIVPVGEEPLSGRAVRQSLGACGFVHGPLQIFHQPGDDGRALLSAASLRNPGTLDPATMDFQRFAGLSLFTVLPGPLAGAAALDHLLHAARDLTQRLHACLQDEHGAPLDAARLENLRRTVQGLPGSRPRAEPTA